MDPRPHDLAAPGEHLEGVLRIIDANANRASEGLRVVEEYWRFIREDAFWASRCKSLRHDLDQVLRSSAFQARAILRDSAGDVGTSIAVDSERRRDDAYSVAIASVKRVEQALRCLEEYGKLADPASAPALEKLRYEAYQVGRAVELMHAGDSQLGRASLYVLVDGADSEDAFRSRITPIVENGADVIQLRDKRLSDRELLSRGRICRDLCADRCQLIVNDRPDLAVAIDAHGVHIGQDEMPVVMARRIVGPHRLVGVSTHSLAQAREAIADGASYLGCGPTFPSQTKSFEDFPGPNFLRQVIEETSVPFFAIGGINLDRLERLQQLGVTRFAIGAAIWASSDVAAATKAFRRQLPECETRTGFPAPSR